MIKYLKDKQYCDKQVAFMVLLLLVVAVLPLLYLGRFAHPCADDFTYGYYAHGFWVTTGSVWEALKWAVNQVKATYDTWQGTFSSAFLMAVSPAVWDESWYSLTPFIMLIMIILPHFLLLYRILVKLLQVPKSIWCIISGISVFCMIEQMTSPVNAFYWYNGAVHYVFMHGCMLLLFTAMLYLTTAGTGKRKDRIIYVAISICACILSVTCGGSNYATALVGLLGTLGILVLQMILGRRRITYWLPVICYSIAFYLNITAYGNTVRQTNFLKAQPLDAILQSFVQLLANVQHWITVPVVIFLLFLIPFWWKAWEYTAFRFRCPYLVTVGSGCFVACMFTPSLYAMNAPGPERLLNIAQMWFYLLLFCNEGYWIGSLRMQIAEKAVRRERKLPDVRIYVGILLVLLLAEFVLNAEGRLFQYSTYAAYVSLRTGEAEQYHQEYLDRLVLLNSEDETVILKEFTQKPWLLYFDDITEDPYDWRNAAVANWYQKDAVYLEGEKR